jgi:hypothetical protein
MSQNEMTQHFAHEIVSAVDDYGWRTEITDAAGFNRSRFNLNYIKVLTLNQFIRLCVVIAHKKGSKFMKWWNDLGKTIHDVASDSDSYYNFLDNENND